MKKYLAILMILMFGATFAPSSAENEFKIAPLEFIEALQDPQQHEQLYSYFSAQVQAQIVITDIPVLWEQVLALGGNFISASETSVEKNGDLTIVVLTLAMEKQNLLFTIAYDSEGNITAFVANPAPAEAPEKIMPQEIVEIEVSFGKEPWVLPGTVTLPKEGKNFPAVALVHGSGANNRNEAVGALAPFQDIAWALAQNGIASIRYDKRTLVYPMEISAQYGSQFTVKEETVDDAIEAAKFIQSYENIDPESIYLVGHSLGAMLGPRIADAAEGVKFAGMILLCGTPKSLVDIIVSQNLFALSRAEDALSKEEMDAQLALVEAEKEKYESLKAEKSAADGETAFGLPAYYLLEMDQYNAAQIIKKLKMPTMIVQAGEDFQVTSKDGIEAWKNELGEETYITYKEYPALNHCLVIYTGDKSLQYTVQEYDTPASVDEDLLQDLINFINH